MRDNTTRKKLLDGEATIGSFLGLGSPHIAEMLGHAGFDWLVLETEHSAVESERVEQMMMALQDGNYTTVPANNFVQDEMQVDVGELHDAAANPPSVHYALDKPMILY